MKKVLVTGKNSYIGNAFCAYVRANYPGQFELVAASFRDERWKEEDWSDYDAILNVAGKAHADISGMTEEAKQEYYDVNCKLACDIAEKAIADGVGQYIYLSSVIVYGDSSNAKNPVHITAETLPSPSNFYGDSKWQAEQQLRKLFEEKAHKAGTNLAVLRLPMVYGKGCKGNFRMLEKLARMLPLFPNVKNERSVLYIENLCEFLCRLIDNGAGGLYFPQNAQYASTAEMVQAIAGAQGKKIRLCSWMNPLVAVAGKMPGKLRGMVKKAFGTLTIDQSLSRSGIDGYQRFGLEESVARGGKS